MIGIKPEYYVDLKGRRYPTWPGVLVALHENGLLGIEVTPLQFPTEENGWMAICQATVRMKGEDGGEQRYTEVGDASPKNCSAMIAVAALRMAATRAKGRAGRDAIACGETLREEMPEEDAGDEAPRQTAGNSQAAAPKPQAAEPKPQAARHAQKCEYHQGEADVCTRFVPENQCKSSQEEFGHFLCAQHSAQLRAFRAKKLAEAQAASATE